MLCLVAWYAPLASISASDRPSYKEQISAGIVCWYTGWYFNATKISINFTLTIDAVNDDNVTVSLREITGNISSLLKAYIINASVRHRMDMVGLLRYRGLTYSSWDSTDIVEVTDADGTRGYDRVDGLIYVIDVVISTIPLTVVLTSTNRSVVQYLDKVVIVGITIIVIFIVVLILYSLVIYPRLHRRQEKQREVRTGAKRRKQVQKSALSKK
jgi:hypothetical protein